LLVLQGLLVGEADVAGAAGSYSSVCLGAIQDAHRNGSEMNKMWVDFDERELNTT